MKTCIIDNSSDSEHSHLVSVIFCPPRLKIGPTVRHFPSPRTENSICLHPCYFPSIAPSSEYQYMKQAVAELTLKISPKPKPNSNIIPTSNHKIKNNLHCTTNGKHRDYGWVPPLTSDFCCLEPT